MAKGSKIIYSVHPAVAMVQKSLASLKEKTGRTLEEWLAFIEAQGPADEKGRIQWLKEKQDLGTNYAKWLAERSFGKGGDEDSPEAYLQAAERYVQNMFSGPKAGLLPLYEKLISLSQSLGKDVKFSPARRLCLLPPPRFCPGEAEHSNSNRFWAGAGRYTGHGAIDRHRRLRQEGSNYAQTGSINAGGYRCGTGKVVENGLSER